MFLFIQLFFISFVQSNDIYEISNKLLTLKQNVEDNQLKEYEWSSSNNEIEEIKIEDSVTRIPSGAFYNFKNLKTITFSSTLTTIGEECFSKCRKIEEINLPESLKTIGKSAFDSCSNLKKITFGKGIENIEANMLYNCYKLKEIEVNQDNAKYKTIENVIFDKNGEILIYYPIGSENKKYIMPTGVKTIKKEAFSFNQLEEIELNKELESIEEMAFYSSKKLKIIEFPRVDNALTISTQSFKNNVNLEEVIFNEREYVIENEAFQQTAGHGGHPDLPPAPLP